MRIIGPFKCRNALQEKSLRDIILNDYPELASCFHYSHDEYSFSFWLKQSWSIDKENSFYSWVRTKQKEIENQFLPENKI